ncbi:hypothetical protein N0V90_010035 [Kalmusia sp. IMI 367209]|nr:hypothetical protein N0V90_010035 [Kalmusia sp. IMI 367209]
MNTLLNLVNAGMNYLTSDISDSNSASTPQAKHNHIAPHTTSYADICVVRAMLESLKLPTELVLEILAFAQYEPVLEFNNGHRGVASAVMGSATSARVCLPAEIMSHKTMRRIASPKVTLKVKEIEFNISSKDQGWTSENTRGTFSTSSWLEVSIFRPSTLFTSLSDLDLWMKEYNEPQELQGLLQSRGHTLVDARPVEASVGPQGGEPPIAWYLQGNRVAQRQPDGYRVLWTPGYFEGNEGAGSGEGFFDALQEGDSVLVWARAKYPGWRCEVDSVKITARYGFDEPLSDKYQRKDFPRNGPGFHAFGLIQELNLVRDTFGEDYVPAYVAGFIERQKTELLLSAKVRALELLLTHPWFQRVWVIQEVVVPQQVTVFYGRQSLSWQEFYEMFQDALSGELVSMFSAMNSGDEMLQAGLKYKGIVSLPFIVAYRMQYHLEGPQSISHVLRIFGEKEATMSIDKVFALIGIAKSYNTDLKRLVDYRKEKDAVLLDLANFLLDNGETSEILDLAGIGRSGRSPNIPSWAVDWTTVRAAGVALNSIFSPNTVRYHATIGTTSSVVRGASQREIVLRGQYVDQILTLVPVESFAVTGPPSLEHLPSAQFSYLDEALKIARMHAKDPYPFLQNQSLEEAVWRTLIGDKTYQIRPAPQAYGWVLKTVLERLVELKNIFVTNPLDVLFTRAVAEKLQTEFGLDKFREFEKANKEAQDLQWLFDSGIGSSPYAFCVTKGGFVGMVPQLSQIGDYVCLIYGFEVPYVLRRSSEEKYKLVGDAYIHGIMDGQALVEGTDEDFTLI